MEPEAMKDLADKIKASPFGQLKGVRILKTSIEIILAYATYLIAMVGEATVTNITVNEKSDWFHIKEVYRKQYIQAFYASYNNYKNTVHSGTSYRKEYINNGVIAAMTLMISTAIGVSDEIFMKAIDPVDWKKSVYPFISGRRKLTPAEKDTGTIIREGQFKVKTGQKGVIYPSIIDFFDHTFPFRTVEKIPSKVNINTFTNITREESDQEREKKVDTYFDVERKTKRAKTSAESAETKVTDRKLRERKSPTIEPPSPSTPQQINRTYPLPTLNKGKSPKNAPKKAKASTVKKSRKSIDQQTPSKKSRSKPLYGKVHPTPTKTNIENPELDEEFLDALEIEHIDDTVRITGLEHVTIGPGAAVEAICRNAAQAAKQKPKTTPLKPTKPSKDDQSSSSADTEYVPESNDPDTSTEEEKIQVTENDEQGNIIPSIEEVPQSDLLTTEDTMINYVTTHSSIQNITKLNPSPKPKKRILSIKSTEIDNKTSPSTKIITSDTPRDEQKDTDPTDNMDEEK